MKSRESFEEKLTKDPTREVEDLVGVRVLVFFRSDLVIAEEVLQRMLILETGSYIDKADLLPDSEFGYRSIQFVGRTKGKGWDADPDPLLEVIAAKGTKVEVQIRTILEHGFAEVEHDLRYKPSEVVVPPHVHRQFALTAAFLEQADTNLDAIKGMLYLGLEGESAPRAAEIKGWDAERFIQGNRSSRDLDRDVRIALDLEKGHLLKSVREVTRAAELAGWTEYSQFASGIEKHATLGRRMAIACADTAHGLALIDYEPRHPPVGFPGVGLFWTALAVALGINDLDPFRYHPEISVPDGRLEEYKAVAKFLIRHPQLPAPTVRDRYRAQAAPPGTTKNAKFRELNLG
ncbi:MAG: GTP pyrophosphokinase [Rhodoglobus sp.]